MDGSPHHELHLSTTHADGGEEWFCPTCGRRLLVHWSPVAEKQILAAGDAHAWHTGSFTHAPQSAPGIVADFTQHWHEDGIELDDQALATGLRPWLNWMRVAGLARQ